MSLGLGHLKYSCAGGVLSAYTACNLLVLFINQNAVHGSSKLTFQLNPYKSRDPWLCIIHT